MTADLSSPPPTAQPVIRRVLLADLLDSPFHKRTNWGDKRDFAKSISENGILQRIVCRVPVDNPNALEIVFGHRRRLGATQGGLTHADVEIREMTDDEVIEAQYRENADRENSHPLDDAHQFWLLTNQFGHDIKTLARRFQKPIGHIRERLRLLKLSPKCRKAYGDGALSHDQARRIAMIPTPAQQNALWEAIRDNRISNDTDVVSWIRRNVLAPLDEDSIEWPLGDRTTPKADGKPGSCNDCPNRTGKQPDLFPDIVGSTDMCAMPKCWQVKMDHAYQRATVAADAGEYEIVDRAPDLIFLQRHGAKPMVARSSGYLDPEADCTLMPGQTWEAAATAAGFTPERVLLRDQDGRPRVLYVERSVMAPIRAAVRNQPESAAAKAEAAVDPARATMRAAKDARAAKETELVKAVLRGDFDFKDGQVLSLAARHIVAPATVKAVARAAGVGVDPETIFTGDVAVPWDLMLLALMVAEVGVSSDPPAEIVAIATMVGVTLSAQTAAAPTPPPADPEVSESPVAADVTAPALDQASADPVATDQPN